MSISQRVEAHCVVCLKEYFYVEYLMDYGRHKKGILGQCSKALCYQCYASFTNMGDLHQSFGDILHQLERMQAELTKVKEQCHVLELQYIHVAEKLRSQHCHHRSWWDDVKAFFS